MSNYFSKFSIPVLSPTDNKPVNTVSDLNSRYPNGATIPIFVEGLGVFYYWNGSSWNSVSGGSGGSGGSGSVLVYNTLTDLQNALPGGSSQPAWVTSDNAWYYWSGAISQPTPPPTPTPPSNVTNLAVSNLSTTTLTLGWTASTGATSYDVYNGATLLGNTASTSFNVSGLAASTSYTFKVVAKNSVGSSSGVTVNATTTATPPADTTAPTVTASPAAGTYTSSQSVTLSATDPDNTAAQITIYYTTDGTTPTTSSSVYNSPISISATTTLKFIGKDTAGNTSSVQSAAYTINAAVLPITDNFSRSDSVTSLGTSSSGAAWIEGDGIIGIKTNASYLATASTIGGDGACNTLAYVQAPTGLQDNVTIKAHIKTVGPYLAQRIIWNFQSAGNYYCLQKSASNGFVFFKYVNGNGTTIKDTMSTDTFASGDTFSVAINGTTFNFYHNDVLVGTSSDSTYSNNGKIGIGGTNPVIDQFKIWQTGTTEPSV